jgi:hypothetical protein
MAIARAYGRHLKFVRRHHDARIIKPSAEKVSNFTSASFDRLTSAAKTMLKEVDAKKTIDVYKDEYNSGRESWETIHTKKEVPSDKSEDYKKAALYENEASRFSQLKNMLSMSESGRVHSIVENEQTQKDAESAVSKLNNLKAELDKRGYFKSELGLKEKETLFTDCVSDAPKCELTQDIQSRLTQKQLDASSASPADLAQAYIEARARTDWRKGLVRDGSFRYQYGGIDIINDIVGNDKTQQGHYAITAAMPNDKFITLTNKGSDDYNYLKNHTKSVLRNFAGDQASFEKIENEMKSDFSMPAPNYSYETDLKWLGRKYFCWGTDPDKIYPTKNQLINDMYPTWRSW